MKINIFKSTIMFFLAVVILLILLVLFELAYYDSSYLNRNALTFSTNNLNSIKTKNFIRYYDNLYRTISVKIFKDHKEYWEPEARSLRADLPEIKIISKKKEKIFFNGQELI